MDSTDNTIPFPNADPTEAPRHEGEPQAPDTSTLVRVSSDDGYNLGASIAGFLFSNNLKDHTFIVQLAYPDGRRNYFGLHCTPVVLSPEMIEELSKEQTEPAAPEGDGKAAE